MKALYYCIAIFAIATLSSYTIYNYNGALLNPVKAASDGPFLTSVYNTNMFEISAGKLALQKSQNSDVKDFANKMIKDHTNLNSNIKAVAETVVVTLPIQISDKDLQDKLAKLKGLDGKAFDAAYVDTNVKDHATYIEMFQKAIDEVGYSAEVKQMASDAIGIIKDHSTMAENLQNKIK